MADPDPLNPETSSPDPLNAETSGAGPFNADPFHTEALRAGVLASWADSPTRFREDANAEEDLLLGGYAGRWLVELAQNAADAAQRAGTPGRLWVRSVVGPAGAELRVANTGAALDADGVTALASLRASTKRGTDQVGRFGVGFAAVLGVSHEPRVISGTGGVLFSRSRTVNAVRELGGVAAEELVWRGDHPPVLRLCWPVPADEPGPPDGYETEVRLPLETDPEELLASAEHAADDLLLALPWLERITVGDRQHVRVTEGTCTRLEPSGRRWLLARRAGGLTEDVDEAVEGRTDWSVCWALPLDDRGHPAPLTADVLHAPTPSDERLGLPARLFATLPMQPSRRRVRTGPATDAVLEQAALAYLELLRSLHPDDRLAAAPAPGFPHSELDEQLHAEITEVLRTAPWLPAAHPAPDAHGQRDDVVPSRAVLCELPGLGELLGPLVPGLLADSAARYTTVLGALGVRTMGLAEVAELLAGVRREPSWWHRVYTELEHALDGAGGRAREELAGLGVPLVDGRTVTGPRTVTVLDGVSPVLVEELVEELRLPGLRVAHPDATHPLLHRLGAVRAGPAELLDSPSVVEAVGRSVTDAEDGLDVEGLARLVLGLLEQIGAGAEASVNRPWLAGLALPDTEGNPCRADELLLPDAALAPLLVEDSPFGVLSADLLEEYPRAVLAGVGVLEGFALVTDDRPTGPDHDLDDESTWWDETHGHGLDGDGEPGRLVAVRDLELVRDDAWPAALALLAGNPDYRSALRAQPGAPTPYTTWWLGKHARLAGRRPRHWRAPEATSLAGLFDPVPDAAASVDRELLAAIGVRMRLTVADPQDAADLLARLADPDRAPDAALAWLAHDRLADAVLRGRVDPADLDPPAALRALDGSVVDADRAVLLDRPWLAAVLAPGRGVAGRWDPDGVAALADLLDLPLASEVLSGRVVANGSDGCDDTEVVRWSSLPEVVSACAALGLEVPEGTLVTHRRLGVELTGAGVDRLDVSVWVQDGTVHATDPVRALLCVRAADSPSSGRGD